MDYYFFSELNQNSRLLKDENTVANLPTFSNATVHEGVEEERCNEALGSQTILYSAAFMFFIVSFLAPCGKYGMLFLHSFLIIAFILLCVWSWSVACSNEIFAWNVACVIVNVGKVLYLLYSMRQVRFAKEFEDIYRMLFEPLHVTRFLFKQLVSAEYGQSMVLQAGEAYAMENVTKTDRLGLLISGTVNVITGNRYLHSIEAKQFLDSPEFESRRPGQDERFKVSIIAATTSTIIYWDRHVLEQLLAKEAHLANAFSLILARDITNKLYSMNERIITEKGSHLDIRLPIITTSLCNSMTSLCDISDPHNIERLGLNDPRVISPLMACKYNRSKSLQTNSLGVPICTSPRMMSRTDVLKSPNKESVELLHSKRLGFGSRLSLCQSSHGIRFKVDKPKN